METDYRVSCKNESTGHPLNEKTKSPTTRLEDVNIGMLQQNNTMQNCPSTAAQHNQRDQLTLTSSKSEYQRAG